MGGVCPGCVRGSAQEEKAYYQTSQYPPWPQQPLPQVPQQRPRPQPKQKQQQPQQVLGPQQYLGPQQVLRPQQLQQPQHVQQSQPQPQQQRRTTEEDRDRSDEARANAAIAAQKRAEAFEKSAGGRAARTAIAAAKANPLPSRNEPGLRWTVG
ncbi:hypothetical protein M758_6G166400 [Ceratodon purpureus]|uniref:Uncharacterized protein n=1 Tax=Ceratodon purpureus TaxID=3225 RepID=A0A8T0HI09_CERPU|nr:hypothetical protein KC19_6G172900 [Ceratodon purpureus]KAG0614304.1 hypothetical protein M758_6G166400 [Ceratodon purpureus]